MRKWITVSLIAMVGLGNFMAAIASSGQALDLDAIRTQQAEIRAGANAGTGLYKDMSESTRLQLLSRQERMLSIIRGKASADQLTEDQRMEVFNELEWIEATINDAEDERMVCERRKKLGSNRRERVCMTVAQQRELRERAREDLTRDSRNMRLGN